MLLETYYNGVEIHRGDKIIYARFLLPHKVLSTCPVSGGFREDLQYLYNHQSVEPCGHKFHRVSSMEVYKRDICIKYGLPPEKCATMGTAANMHNAAFSVKSFEDLTVIAVCTAGVETNAGRAGDPAAVLETPEGFKRLTFLKEPLKNGTINIMLFISKPLTNGAMVRSVVTATEAKTAALQELAVNSRYSDGLATGTGTDQIIVASPLEGSSPLTSAGKHSKLGELIGLAVIGGVKDALARQNNLTPWGQASAKIHLERFGLTRETMQEMVCRHLNDELARLFRDNFETIDRDPLVVAAVASAAHLKDKFRWGLLPMSCWSDVMGTSGAVLACAVSGRYDRMNFYRNLLAPMLTESDNQSFMGVLTRAMALGYSEKWLFLDNRSWADVEEKSLPGKEL